MSRSTQVNIKYYLNSNNYALNLSLSGCCTWIIDSPDEDIVQLYSCFSTSLRLSIAQPLAAASGDYQVLASQLCYTFNIFQKLEMLPRDNQISPYLRRFFKNVVIWSHILRFSWLLFGLILIGIYLIKLTLISFAMISIFKLNSISLLNLKKREQGNCYQR